MKEYNELTKRLLAEGYTAENHPNYVRIGISGYNRENPLDNFNGGFMYIRMYAEKIVYKTGCGKFIMGKSTLSNMSCMGVEWSHENNNPVHRCPYDKPECESNDSRLHGMRGGGLCIQCWCVCHRTDEPYNYENSIEKAEQERMEEKEKKYMEYCETHNGRVCRNHMFTHACQCNSCGARTKNYRTWEEAAKAWNKREKNSGRRVADER